MWEPFLSSIFWIYNKFGMRCSTTPPRKFRCRTWAWTWSLLRRYWFELNALVLCLQFALKFTYLSQFSRVFDHPREKGPKTSLWKVHRAIILPILCEIACGGGNFPHLCCAGIGLSWYTSLLMSPTPDKLSRDIQYTRQKSRNFLRKVLRRASGMCTELYNTILTCEISFFVSRRNSSYLLLHVGFGNLNRM